MLYFFLSLFLFLSSSAWAMGHVPISGSPFIGKPAPDTVLSKSDGTSDSVVASAKGQKIIVVFWATWCSNCYDELGDLYSNLDAIQRKGIKIELVDLAESKEVVNKYFDKRQMKWVSFLDIDQYLQATYHLEGIPTLVFIDEKGIVRNMTHQFPLDYPEYF